MCLQHALRRQRAVAAEARLRRLRALGAPRRALRVQLRDQLVADPGELARGVLPQIGPQRINERRTRAAWEHA